MSSHHQENGASNKWRTDSNTDSELHATLDQISFALRGLKFGNVNVVVQDGVVVQIDRTEKVRLRTSQRS